MSIRALTVTVLLLASSTVQADVFDQYTNRDITKYAESDGAVEVQELTSSLLVERGGLLPGTNGALVFLRTTEGRYAKMLVHAARQKVGEATVPMLLVERYVCFQEGTERAVHTAGRDVRVYPGFRFSLDVGQVVPEKLSGDFIVPEAGRVLVKAIGRAKFYVVSKLPPATADPKSPKVVVGDQFETRYFNGTFQLHDDGRRSGKLILTIDEAGGVSGSFYSDKDGQKYEVTGKVGSPKHAIAFSIKYPRVEQSFAGFMFTGDGKAIAGTCKMQERDAAFYATRIEKD
ncbi:MAG: hypothetical protein U0746_01730 [Gemmataceae bacterium]